MSNPSRQRKLTAIAILLSTGVACYFFLIFPELKRLQKIKANNLQLYNKTRVTAKSLTKAQLTNKNAPPQTSPTINQLLLSESNKRRIRLVSFDYLSDNKFRLIFEATFAESMHFLMMLFRQDPFLVCECFSISKTQQKFLLRTNLQCGFK